MEERVKTRDVDAVSALKACSKAVFYSIHRRMDSIEETMETTGNRLTGVEDTTKLLLQQSSTIIGLLRHLTVGGAAATAAAAAAPPEDLGQEGEFCFPFLLVLLSSYHLSTNSLFSL